jgi:hypothetical protein
MSKEITKDTEELNQLQESFEEMTKAMATFVNLAMKEVIKIIRETFSGVIEIVKEYGIKNIKAIESHDRDQKLFKERRRLYKSKIKDHQWIKPIKINYSNGWRC